MIGKTFQFAWEIELIKWCQNNLSNSIIKILDIFSITGDTLAIVAILAFMYLCFDKKVGKRLVVNTLVSLLIGSEIKNIFVRRRPYFDNDGVKCLKIVDDDYDMYDIIGQGFSFPSMHSSNIATVFGTIYHYYKKRILIIIGVIVSLIVGISRFVLGCHYPTDVLFGWLMGIAIVIIFSKLQDKLDDNKIFIIVLLIGFVGFFFCDSKDFFSIYGIYLGFVVSCILDRKYIHFSNTRNVLKMVLRLLLACICFLITSEGIKYIQSLVIASDTSYINNLIVVFRYGLAMFIGFGITPIIYKYNIFKLNDNIYNKEK